MAGAGAVQGVSKQNVGRLLKKCLSDLNNATRYKSLAIFCVIASTRRSAPRPSRNCASVRAARCGIFRSLMSAGSRCGRKMTLSRDSIAV